jgi:hypothetical protein
VWVLGVLVAGLAGIGTSWSKGRQRIGFPFIEKLAFKGICEGTNCCFLDVQPTPRKVIKSDP